MWAFDGCAEKTRAAPAHDIQPRDFCRAQLLVHQVFMWRGFWRGACCTAWKNRGGWRRDGHDGSKRCWVASGFILNRAVVPRASTSDKHQEDKRYQSHGR